MIPTREKKEGGKEKSTTFALLVRVRKKKKYASSGVSYHNTFQVKRRKKGEGKMSRAGARCCVTRREGGKKASKRRDCLPVSLLNAPRQFESEKGKKRKGGKRRRKEGGVKNPLADLVDLKKKEKRRRGAGEPTCARTITTPLLPVPARGREKEEGEPERFS